MSITEIKDSSKRLTEVVSASEFKKRSFIWKVREAAFWVRHPFRAYDLSGKRLEAEGGYHGGTWMVNESLWVIDKRLKISIVSSKNSPLAF